MISVHTGLEQLKNAPTTGLSGFVFGKISAGKSRDYRDVIVFEKLRFQIADFRILGIGLELALNRGSCGGISLKRE